MKSTPAIKHIVSVEPFKVTCIWNTGEVRVNDFGTEREKWKHYEVYAPLVDYRKFREVKIGEFGTLQWNNVLIDSFLSNQKQPLDFDPTVLYETSKPLSAYRLVPVEEVV